MAEEQEPEAPPTAEEPSTGGGGMVLMLALVGFVVVAESAMFFVLVPSAEEVSLMAEENLIKEIQQVGNSEEEEGEDENELQEFQLGMFNEVFSPHDTEREFQVRLKLYGLIRVKNAEKMEKEFAAKEGRIHSKIRFRLRNSSVEELSDNNLGLLERRILTACNDLLEEEMLLGVGFKSYDLSEQ